MPRWLDRWAEKRMEKGRRILAESDPAPAPDLAAILTQTTERVRDAVAGAYDARAGVIDPCGVDFARPPAQAEDPAERERIAAAERAARDAARAPYRVTDGPVFTRFATYGERQLSDLTETLASFRPDAVFGAYRVPDRFEETHGDERRAYLEWEIVHAPDAAGTGEVELAAFRRADHWERRSPGEPRVLDEDMAAALVDRVRLDPEDCFGVTRLWHVRVDGELHATASVEGSLVIGRPGLVAAQRALAAEAPLDVGPPAFHVTTLDWEAVAAWVAPKRFYPPRVPSPLPHLPATPQELLRMYLEVVGVRASDSYGAQVTRTTDSGLADLGPAGRSRDFRLPRFPCADGTDRERQSAAEDVVIAYRDRPEYGEGRRRWAAYEDEVLHARLSHRTDVRPPLEVTGPYCGGP
jgi:hypothetical protein